MGTCPPHLVLTETIFDVDHAQVSVGFDSDFQYLVVEVPDDQGKCWVCAPVSDRAIDCVRSGRTSPWTVVHHSVTGTVDVYRLLADGSVHESVVLCSDLPDRRPVLAAA